MAGRRRSFPPRRMGPDLLRLLDGPIVSRRRSRHPAPPRGMGPNHPRAAGGSLQRVSRAAAMHQRSAGRKRPWGRNAPRSDQAGRVLERRGVTPDEGLRARWWQWPRHPTFRAMARVAEGWFTYALVFGVGVASLRKRGAPNVVGPQRQEGVAIAAGCRRISAKAPHAIMVTSEAREQGHGPLGQVLDRHQLSFHKARDRQGNLIQVGPVVPVVFVSSNLIRRTDGNPQRCALCLGVRDGPALWCRCGVWRVLHVPPRKDYRTSNVLLVKLTRPVRHIGRAHAEGAITPDHCSVCAVHPPRAHRLHLSRWGVKDAPRFSGSGWTENM